MKKTELVQKMIDDSKWEIEYHTKELEESRLLYLADPDKYDFSLKYDQRKLEEAKIKLELLKKIV